MLSRKNSTLSNDEYALYLAKEVKNVALSENSIRENKFGNENYIKNADKYYTIYTDFTGIKTRSDETNYDLYFRETNYQPINYLSTFGQGYNLEYKTVNSGKSSPYNVYSVPQARYDNLQEIIKTSPENDEYLFNDKNSGVSQASNYYYYYSNDIARTQIKNNSLKVFPRTNPFFRSTNYYGEFRKSENVDENNHFVFKECDQL